MAEDFTGLLKKFLHTYSSKIKYHRSAAQGLLENEIYLKKNSYIARLRLDIQLFHMEATTTSLFTVRRAFLLFLAVPSSIIGQYYFIMEVFYKIFVFDVGVVKRRKILPLNLPADEDISYWPMWRVFVEHYLLSYDFWILFFITSFVVYGIVLATASTNFLWSSDPDAQEWNGDKKDFSHMALQVSLKSKGEIAYIYEFKRIEMFLKAEVYLHLLSLDVHAFLGTKSLEEINREFTLIMGNLEFYLEQVANMILQLREEDSRLLKDQNIAKIKKIAQIKALYNHIYDFETSENIDKVYEALYIYWLLEGDQGIVYYFEFEHMLRKKESIVGKKKGKQHPRSGHCFKFSQKQAEIRLQTGFTLKTMQWRRHRWILKNFEEQHNNLTALETLKKWTTEKAFILFPESGDGPNDLLDYTVEYLHKHSSQKEKIDLKNNSYAHGTVWNLFILNLLASSLMFKIFVLKRRLHKLFIELQGLWQVIYERYLKNFFEKRNK